MEEREGDRKRERRKETERIIKSSREKKKKECQHENKDQKIKRKTSEKE